MLHVLMCAAIAALPAEPSATTPSDPVAVYALLTAVDLLPNAGAPERVRLHGAFAVATSRFGDYYRAPRWGSLLFSLTRGEEDACRTQWADLARLAGTGTIVGIGSRYEMPGLRVQPAGQEKDEATPYATSFGLQKVRNADYGPVLWLKLLPKPIAPSGEIAVPEAGERSRLTEIELVAENCLDRSPGLAYHFEVIRADGERLASPPVSPGDKTTSWKVALVLAPGEKVTWTVCVVRDGSSSVPVAAAELTTRQAERRG